MFTPPPSPLPMMRDDPPHTPVLEAGTSKNFPPEVNAKRRTSRLTRWTVILIPCTLILVTAFTRYFMHPRVFDVFSATPQTQPWNQLVGQGLWTPHKRHNDHDPRQLASSTSSSTSASSAGTSATPTSTTSGPVPTIPSSPPALPTPFPQPYDADLTQNFSSTTCFTFFSNMTGTAPFRSCRPLSLLQDTSAAFINAQTNLTLLNSIIWGTCNTNTDRDLCIANMGWFADSLEKACTKDLQDQNDLVVRTLTDLRAYALVRDAGCLAEPTTNTYCYVNAVNNPSDLYFYGLPLGSSLPKTTKPLCSACTRSLMGTYLAALDDPAQLPGLNGLRKTYNDAATLAIAQCGTGFAATKVLNGARSLLGHGISWWTGGTIVLLGTLLQTFS